MQVIIIGVVAEFNVEIAQVVEQKYVLAFVAVCKDVAREVKRVELLVGRKAGKIGGLHKLAGLTSEINKKRAAHQMSRPTLYTTIQTPIAYN